ncbi:YqzE family protein [Paenibacillus tarimensis]|uniref:YqzE family protein n=1 Tax=Paenibacillus tarimensis TaxID=416012 RepID=UPI001F17395A|nr:YqzE family protein [Paenibacillus tarimensis]MCF2943269.1 YqzE family protein [Paenibacillus tarimensis]
MKMKDGAEYVKYVTARLVRYIDTPSEERRRIRLDARKRKEPWLVKWFGWAPYSVLLWYRSMKTKLRPGTRMPADLGQTEENNHGRSTS